MTEGHWTLRRALGPADMAHCLAIRAAVFIDEQGVPPELERDGLDGGCIQYLALGAERALATARVMALPDRFKFQRVAVLPEARGTGLGAALMRFMMADLAAHEDIDGRVFYLSSQVSAIGFYEKLGFSICSGEYLDAGLVHRDMRRSVGTAV